MIKCIYSLMGCFDFLQIIPYLAFYFPVTFEVVHPYVSQSCILEFYQSARTPTSVYQGCVFFVLPVGLLC